MADPAGCHLIDKRVKLHPGIVCQVEINQWTDRLLDYILLFKC